MVARALGHINVIQVKVCNVIGLVLAVVQLDIFGVAQLVVNLFVSINWIVTNALLNNNLNIFFQNL